ncbi:CPBP family intramembrane glutamic endopeptidase [Mycobacterium sp. AMU20-3851]|uniref:CPBP family intramembrane glutamic endopeptidase n=1 Tax=Mycobacterium sp. AMU20-3851 TaxID=3122055 RepID=UPI0037552095
MSDPVLTQPWWRTQAVGVSEPPSVVRRRRITVAVVLVIGAVLLGLSLTRSPGDASFYWLTLAMAAVWIGGGILSGPLQLGTVRYAGQERSPALAGTAVGLILAAAFVAGALVAREIPGVREYITDVLLFANQGALSLVVFITVINGIAEEVFFRGALYTALGTFYPAIVSTVIYIFTTLASGNPMLGFAAVLLGAVCAYERRVTGGVLAPMLTHFWWGLAMVLVLPPLFGV